MEIDKLQISISADASKAIKAYKELGNALAKLQKVTQEGNFGFANLAMKINKFASVTKNAVQPIKELGDALDKIQRFNNGGTAKIAKATKAVAQAVNNANPGKDGERTIDVEEIKDVSSFVDDLGDSAETSGKKAKKAATGWEKFTKSIAKIAVYRAIRRILSEISNAAKEGTDNFYIFLNASNDAQSKKMVSSLDKISSALMALGNTFGVTILSFLVTVQPLIEAVTRGVIEFLNVINALIAKLQGSTWYYKANEEAIKKWSESINHALQGFDELNVISSSTGTSPFSMFEKGDVDETLQGLGKETAKVVGLVAAYKILKALAGALAGAFKNKNGTLSEQSGLTEEETGLVGNLGNAFGYATDDATELDGALGALGGVAVVTAIGGLIASISGIGDELDTAGDSVGEFETGLASGMETSTSNVTGFVSSIKTAFDNITSYISQPLSVLNSIADAIKNLDGKNAVITIALNAVANAGSETSTNTAHRVQPANGATFTEVLDGVGKYDTAPVYEILTKEEIELSASKGQNILDAITAVVGGGMAVSSLGTALKAIGAAGEAASVFIMPIKQIEEALRLWKIGRGKGSGGSIETRATGGFVNSAELFYANENGVPEMVGRIGNRTAVANTEQITEAIASAVYDAMMSADQGKNVNVVLEGDAKKLFKVVQNEAKSYYRTTGAYAF